MAKIPVLDALRIIPREAEFLNRKSGLRGEIFYDQTANTLRIYNGSSTGGLNLARGDLANVTNNDFDPNLWPLNCPQSPIKLQSQVPKAPM